MQFYRAAFPNRSPGACQQLCQQCGRHRSALPPATTPPGFWDASLSYEDTLEGSLVDAPADLPTCPPQSAPETPRAAPQPVGSGRSAEKRRREAEEANAGEEEDDEEVSLFPEPPQLFDRGHFAMMLPP